MVVKLAALLILMNTTTNEYRGVRLSNDLKLITKTKQETTRVVSSDTTTTSYKFRGIRMTSLNYLEYNDLPDFDYSDRYYFKQRFRFENKCSYDA